MNSKDMKPVNFIDLQKNRKSQKLKIKNIIFIIPLIIVLIAISYDYNYLNKNHSVEESSQLYSEDEILIIREEIDSLRFEKEKLLEKLDVLNSLDKRHNQVCFSELINMSLDKDTDQDFLVELNYLDENIYYIGNCVDEKILEDKVVYFNEKDVGNLIIDKVDYSNGYFTYILKVEDN